MAGLYSDPIRIDPLLDQLGINQFQSNPAEILGAMWADQRAGSTTNLVQNWIDISTENSPTLSYTTEIGDDGTPRTVPVPNPRYVESPLLQPDEANAKYGIKQGTTRLLGWVQPVREREAQQLQRLKREELYQQSIINRGTGGFWQGASQFVVGGAANLIDPLNILSAFIPVVGEARAAAMLAQVGSSVIGRGVVRAGIGAVEGTVGAAMLEPINYALSKYEQRDYTALDSLTNIAFGGVLGGGLHVPVGYAKDRFFGIARLIDDAPMQVKQAMLGDALTSVMEGRPVRADLALREHLLGGSSNLTPFEMARSRFETAMGPFPTPERVGIDMGGPRVGVDVPHPLAEPTGSVVPVLARNGEMMEFTTLKRAENAARRISRDEGYQPSVLERQDGSFILRRESQMEPLRQSNGSVMTFPNHRQAQRYVDNIALRDGPDIDPVTGTGREYQVIKFHDGTGPVKYALVQGATDADIAASAKGPGHIELRSSKDLPTSINDAAARITEQRDQFLNEVTQWNRDRYTPLLQTTREERTILTEHDARLARAKGDDEAIRRSGGGTEITQLQREIDDLAVRVGDIEKNGELPAGARALLDDADALVAKANAEAEMYGRIAACIR